ncbi:MAG: PLP-dependent aminotransferase family protein [Deltaproteobacteria bacterium]|nr:PLP-dependent aminotransferase family protein [Deltaproteobacteria bacterium]
MDTETIENTNFQYVKLANEIEERIKKGEFTAGEKLTSLRKMHKQSGLSITTVYQSYIELEKRGIIESRSKSGFFVKPLISSYIKVPDILKPKIEPRRISINSVACSIVENLNDPNILHLGASAPPKELLPIKQLAKIIKKESTKNLENIIHTYGNPSGNISLRKQILKRTVGKNQKNIYLDDIIITSGCLNAVTLCLKAITKKGDTVAVESPTFHCFLQLIEDLGLMALELPTNISTGVELDNLEQILDENNVKVCLFIPTFNNPIGSNMPAQKRKEIVELLNRKEIPVIEDDIHGDLFFEGRLQPTLKSFDRKGLVLYCSSFSKSISPGLRVGWVIPGRFKENIKRLKLNTTVATPTLNEFVIAEYLKSGAHDRHLKTLRNRLRNQMSIVTNTIAQCFPEGVKISVPAGGMSLWVQLSENINTFDLYKKAMEENISFLPGGLCSGTGKYNHCMRISCGLPFDEKLKQGLDTIGRIIKDISLG